jgi:hypothetical protein
MSARQRRQKENRRSRAEARRRRFLAASGLTAGATLAMSGVAHAAPTTFTVGSLDDTTGAADCADATNTDCTLRQAIIDANSNPGADTIVFRSGLTGTITLTSDPEQIVEAVAIQGPGSSQITVDGGGNYRTFSTELTTSYDPVSIAGLTMTNGSTGYGGGGVYNDNADLTISNSVISDSYATSAAQSGGGVYTQTGSLTIDHSTITGNHAYYGGGVGAPLGDVTIVDSTVSDNEARGEGPTNYSNGYGGGIWTGDADLTVERSTLTENVATDGGGIYASNRVGSGGSVTIKNSTLANNHAAHDDGGAVWMCCSQPHQTFTAVSATITGNTALTTDGGLEVFTTDNPVIENSIVSGNSSPNNASTDDLDTYTDPGLGFETQFSLIGVPGAYVVNTVPGSNIGYGSDPQLGPLQDNGGPTHTELPASTSPVVNKGSAFGLTTDQRGLTRPIAFPGVPTSTAPGADGSDIGAVELQAQPTPPGQTGQRAAALKKCKKKHKKAVKKKKANGALNQSVKKKLNKKFKKCKKKANKLPV